MLAFLLIAAFVALAPKGAGAALDYTGMVTRIDAFLNEAVALYRAGDADGAKAKVQQSYFEVFENLEGPIRVNVSARKNIELEAAFGDIRKMIVRGDAPDALAARVAAHLGDLHGVLPKLLDGVHLQAETEDGAEDGAAGAPAQARVTHPHWGKVADTIAATLERAAAAYEAGDGDGARALVMSAQFEGYKNSLLETAIRRFVSQRQEAEYNSEFTRIVALIRDGRPVSMVRGSVAALVDDLRRTLPGVPLVDGARSEQTAAGNGLQGQGQGQGQAQAQGQAQDWRAVAHRIAANVARAVALYRDNQPAPAMAVVQDTYFDLFEASGMEDRIGARDGAFKTTLEGHFSRLAAAMKAGAAPAEVAAAATAMSADFDRAVTVLTEGRESPAALFVYSLFIILREGVEALLIVTAILAYLAKTGNGNKQRVIHNSVFSALGASVITAFVLKGMLNASAASQEVLEGVTMLVAAVVLFTMSFWLISKAEAQKWMAYIKGKVDHSASSGSLWALWFTSFLAVYREGAETVLFYQALTIDADATGTLAIAGGFALGCALLAIVCAAMRYGATKLPIRPFFMTTGALLYALAFVFAGKGMMELVEGKVLEPTLVPWLPEVPLLGVFPYWQTAAPQMVLVLAAALSALALFRRRPHPAIAGRSH
jgi:high-affinity iron transporter